MPPERTPVASSVKGGHTKWTSDGMKAQVWSDKTTLIIYNIEFYPNKLDVRIIALLL
jgi:hypothetical protein